MLADQLGHIKGAAFREFLVFYARKVDSDRVVAAVRETKSHLLYEERSDFGVMQNVWYPAELVNQLLDRLTEGLSEPALVKLAQDGAIHVMGVTLRGVYKTLFSLIATPERYATNMPAALPIYEAMGCKGVSWERTHCKSVGSGHCTAVVSWRR